MIRKLLAAGLLTGLPLLAACGPQVPATGTSAGASATVAASNPAGQAASPIDQILQAQANLKTYSMTMDMTMDMGSEVKTTVKMTVDQSDPELIKMKGTTSFSGMEVNLIVIGGTTYAQNPLSGNKWQQISSTEASQYETNTNLGKAMQQLKSAVSNTENLGTETVDGVETTHYRFTLDTSKYNEELDGAGVVSGDDFKYDVWVDADGRLRKISSKMTMEIQERTVTTEFTGTISGFDEPVTIEAPKVG